MSMIKDQENNIEKAITKSLRNKSLEVAAMRIDSLLFTDYVIKHKPQNIKEAIRFHLETKHGSDLKGDISQDGIDKLKTNVHQKIESGEFNMRFFYPDTQDVVSYDNQLEEYTKELRAQGVLMPGMDAQKTRDLTLVAYFAQHVVGDMDDYSEIQHTVHRNISSSIGKLHQGENITAADLLRVDPEEGKDEPLALLSNSHLVKKLSERQFVYDRDIAHAAEAVNLKHTLNKGASPSP